MTETPTPDGVEPAGASAVIDGDEVQLAGDQSAEADLGDLEDEL